ncbi:hypothetical protein BVRB_1g023060 [Beta vulgaris subsp. vulgaris]|uniref:Uncharacterized protein n=1 Tax=Beta vulgaris subsp. vulgaris TaxID=3555 RepID=A0A0J8E8W3_BETVV|nr:hypothetical protein BVRB_1g023060 [Beta vulgaris subsp. vulgaris]
MDCHRLLDLSDLQKPYISKKKKWDDLFKKYQSGDDFKKMFVIFSLSKFFCSRGYLGSVLNCAKSLENVSMISSYDWCGNVSRSLCTAVLDYHQNIMTRKNEFGQKKVTFKIWRCMSALTLAVIHNFKSRNLDFTNVSKPFITYWQEDKHLTTVVKQFKINMDFILPIKRDNEKEKDYSRVLKFKAHCTREINVASVIKSGSPTINVVEGPLPSTRQLVMNLPRILMIDEQIDYFSWSNFFFTKTLVDPSISLSVIKIGGKSITNCLVEGDEPSTIFIVGESDFITLATLTSRVE